MHTFVFYPYLPGGPALVFEQQGFANANAVAYPSFNAEDRQVTLP